MSKEKDYWVMDGRAHYSIDDATVLVCCSTLDEAYRSLDDFGSDSCIVDPDTKTIIDSLMWRDGRQGE